MWSYFIHSPELLQAKIIDTSSQVQPNKNTWCPGTRSPSDTEIYLGNMGLPSTLRKQSLPVW